MRMRTGAIKLLSLVCALLLVASFLAGCGGGGGTTETPTGKTTQPATTQPGVTTPTATGNRAPVITSVNLPKTALTPGEEILLICDASDPDGDKLTFAWSASGGVFSVTESPQNRTNWKAPEFKGDFTLTATVSDDRGASTKQNLTVTVSDNHAPVVSAVNANPATLKRGETSNVSCTATDQDKDVLSYKWEATGGEITGVGAAITWKAPDADGIYTIKVTVDDGKGGVTPGSVVITVQNPANTVTLTAVTAESGSVDSNGALSSTFIVGDSANDAGVRTYLSFDLAQLQGLEIKEAILTLTAKQTVGNPWFTPPFLHVEPVAYGARAIAAGDYNMATSGGEIARYNAQVPDKIDVTYQVQQVLFKGHFQIRLRMASNSNLDKVADYIEFSKAEITVTFVK
ncbi:MAG: hypothetical protein V1894_01970 [Chloroflexota bacterium]